MSGYRPPPNQGFPPPGGHFPPPPGGGGFPPPQPGAGGFPPPPNRPPPAVGAGFGPPPGGVHQLNQGMGNMSLQGSNPPPPPGGQFAPPPPAAFRPAPPAGTGAPTMFQPPPVGGAPPQMMQPPATPQQQQPPHGQLNAQGAPSPFFQQPPSQAQMQRVGGAAPTGAPAAGMSAPFQEIVDFNIQIPERLFRLSAKKIPQTAAMMTSSKIPVGAVLRPLAPLGPDDEAIDTVQPGNAGIIRCKRCRTYINAFVTWLENGRRWRCNICAQLNDCPSTYFCHLDEQGLRRDRMQRPELSKGVVEFIAPAEYMVRPPQEPSYFFAIDVSATAVRSGMLQCVANGIRQSLDELPGRGRTKIGFITYDNSVHYYNLAPDLSNPQMMVVSDLKELFVPLPDHLLVNLKESRAVVDAFLDNLPDMFAKNPVVSQSCLGPALKAAFTVMKQIGGKMCVFQSIMPNLGDGALRPRENHAIMGTPNEATLLRPDIAWYKETAVEFSRQQISVDMFLFPYQYMDLAALGELPKYTSGSLHSYVSFNPDTDGPQFESQLVKTLTQTTAFEAVMRIRCTKGMRITNFYGNFFIRGTDLLALPNCNSESVFAFDLAHDEQNMTTSVVTVQAALLYTSSDGERRIRVMTQALPVTSLTSELIASVDADTVCNLLAKQALDVSSKTTLDNARMRLQQTCVDIIRCAKGGDKRVVSGYSVPGPQGGGDGEGKQIPENLKLLPLYTLAMMKNVAFRGGTDVHPDERLQAHHLLNNMWVDVSRHYIYPRMFSVHDMEPNAGYPVEDAPESSEGPVVAGRERTLLPKLVNLSVDRLASDGIFLLDNGLDMYLWVGRSVHPDLLNALFQVDSLENADMSQVMLQTSGDDFAVRLGSIVNSLREDDADPFVISPKVNIIREGDAHMEARFFWHLVEDRASFQGGTYSYSEFMHFVNNPGGHGQSGSAPPAAGGMPGRGPPPPGGPPQPHGMPSQGPPHQGMVPPSGPPGGYGPPPAAPSGGHGPPPPGPPGGYGPPPPGPSGGYGPPPPGPPGGYGPPPPGAQGGYGPPPPGAQGGYGPPPPGSQGGYGPPPPGSQGGYGPPPPGSQGGYGPPPPGSQGGYGPPPPGSQGGYGPPPPGSQGGYGPPPSGSQGGYAQPGHGVTPPQQQRGVAPPHHGMPPPPGSSSSASHSSGPPPGRAQQQTYGPPPGRATSQPSGPPAGSAPAPPQAETQRFPPPASSHAPPPVTPPQISAPPPKGPGGYGLPPPPSRFPNAPPPAMNPPPGASYGQAQTQYGMPPPPPMRGGGANPPQAPSSAGQGQYY